MRRIICVLFLLIVYLLLSVVGMNFLMFALLKAAGTDVILSYTTYGFPCHNGKQDNYSEFAKFMIVWGHSILLLSSVMIGYVLLRIYDRRKSEFLKIIGLMIVNIPLVYSSLIIYKIIRTLSFQVVTGQPSISVLLSILVMIVPIFVANFSLRKYLSSRNVALVASLFISLSLMLYFIFYNA